MEFTEILRGRYGLSERAAGVLMRHASQSVHARKEIIVEEGQRDQEIRFVTEGSARSYVMREDKCVILSFAFEGDPTSSQLRRHEEYFADFAWRDKSEQYKRVLREYPQLLQRIALKDLAAYLFLTPQSLSRIRAEIK